MNSEKADRNGTKEKVMLSLSTVAVFKIIGFLLLVAVFCSVYGVRAMITREMERKETGSGTRELMKIIQKDEELLRDYNWLNKDSGKVSIPVQQAMELMLKKSGDGQSIDTSEGPDEE